MGIKSRRSGGKMGGKTDWFNPDLARSAMDTPAKKGMGPNFYESYSGGGVMNTATDRGNIMRPELPPLREAGVIGRALNNLAGPDRPWDVAKRPSRADRKTYQRNMSTYNKLRASSPNKDPFY